MYAKVFTSIWDGSLYGKLEASAVLMACVTLCNADGILDMTHEAIAGRTGWPIEFVQEGIRQLEEPDDRSRTPDEDGRRMVRLDDHRNWGWLIVNYEKYRGLKDLEVIREQTRVRVAKFREMKRTVTHGNAGVTQDNAPKRQEEAEAEAIKNKVEKVFDHWRETWKHPQSKLDSKRRRIISAALKLYSSEDLCRSISGYLNSSHHTGKNDRNTVYDSIELFLRDANHIDSGLKFYEQNGATQWR